MSFPKDCCSFTDVGMSLTEVWMSLTGDGICFAGHLTSFAVDGERCAAVLMLNANIVAGLVLAEGLLRGDTKTAWSR